MEPTALCSLPQRIAIASCGTHDKGDASRGIQLCMCIDYSRVCEVYDNQPFSILALCFFKCLLLGTGFVCSYNTYRNPFMPVRYVNFVTHPLRAYAARSAQ